MKEQEKCAVEGKATDYEMDEFDRLDPFDETFRPDKDTPRPTPPLSPIDEGDEGDDDDDDDDDKPLPPPLSSVDEGDETDEAHLPQPSGAEGSSKRGQRGTPKDPSLKKKSESVELRTLNSLLTKYGENPNCRVASKKSQFYGYSIEDNKKA